MPIRNCVTRGCWLYLLAFSLSLNAQSYVTHGSSFCGTLADVFVDHTLLTDYNAVRLSSGHVVNANSTHFSLPDGAYALEVQPTVSAAWDTLLLFEIAEINEPVPIVVRTTQPSCEVAGGTIHFGPETGMNAEFLYSLVPEGSPHFFTANQDHDALGPGSYELAMRVIGNDEPACVAYKTVTLSAADEIGFSVTVTPATSCAGNDGSIGLTPETPGDYEFRLVPGSWSGNTYYGNLTAGHYTVEARPAGNDNGTCVVVRSVLVGQAAPVDIPLTLQVSPPTACGRADAQVNVTNPLPDTLLFRINGGAWQELAFFGGLSAGTYTVEVRGEQQTLNGCYSSSTVTVTEPPAPSLQLAHAPPTICGGFDGLVNLFVTPVPAPGISYDYSVRYDGMTQALPGFQFEELGSGIDYVFAVEPTGNTKAACRVESALSVAFVHAPEVSLETDNPTFCTQENGSIQLLEASGHLIQSYLVGGNGYSLADNRLENIGAGHYAFTAYPAALNVDYLPSPCVVNVAAELVSPAISNLDIAAHAPTACGVSDGALNVVNLVGDPALTYEFSLDGQQWQEAFEFADLAEGNYQLFARPQGIAGSEDCTISQGPVGLVAPAVPELSVDLTHPSACGRADGSIAIGEGEEEALEYSLNGAAFQEQFVFSGLTAGNYEVRYRPRHSTDPECVRVETVVLEQPAAPTLSLSVMDPSACGRADGSVVLSATGAGEFEYAYGNETYGSQIDFTDLLAGEHGFSVRPTNSLDSTCTTATMTILEQPAAPTLLLSAMDPSACGRADGSVILQSTGAGEFEYAYGNGAYGPITDFIDLLAGEHGFSVRPTNSLDSTCTTMAITVLEQPAAPTLSLTATDPSACGRADGSVILSATGVGEFEYAYGTGAYGSLNDFADLLAGEHSFSVHPTNSLDSTCTTTETTTLEQPAAPTLSLTTTDPSACGRDDGSVILSATGVGEFEYAYGNGAYGSLTDFTDLLAGEHGFSVRPTNSLVSTCTTTTMTFLEQPAAPTLSLMTIDPSACGRADGSVILSATGVGEFEYAYGTGAYGSLTDFTDLLAGEHGFSVRPTNSLDSICTTTVMTTLEQPAAPTLSLTATDPSACGRADGSVILSAMGAGEFEYAYGDGAYGSLTDFTDLLAGDHGFSVRPTNSLDSTCTTTAMTILEQPAAPTLSLTATDPTACGLEDGSLQLSGSGSGPFDYFITGSGWGNNGEFTGLASGQYELYVRPSGTQDLIGCTDTASVVLESPALPALLTEFTVPASCAELNGELSLAPSQFEDGITYRMHLPDGDSTAWTTQSVYDGLMQGIYTAELRLNGSQACLLSEVIDLTNDELPAMNLTTQSPGSCGLENGSVMIGFPPTGTYEFRLTTDDPWQADHEFTTLRGDSSYTVYLRGNGDDQCQTSHQFYLAAGPLVDVAFDPVFPSDCGADDGSFIPLLSGGDPADEYAFRAAIDGEGLPEFAPIELFTNAVATTYTVEVAMNAAPHCTQSFLLDLSVAEVPSVTLITQLDPDACGSENGTLEVSAMHSGTYEFALNDPEGSFQASGLFDQLMAGNYTVFIRPVQAYSAGCLGSAAFHLTQPEPVDFSIEASAPTGCGSEDGSLIAIPEVNSAPLNYELRDSLNVLIATNATGQFFNLAAGTYRLSQLTNGLEICAVTQTIALNATGAPQVEVGWTQPPSQCGLADGSLLIANLDNGDYRYSLSADGQFQNAPLFSGLAAGDYEVYVRRSDASDNFCAAILALSLSAPPAPAITAVYQLEDPHCVQANASIIVTSPSTDFEEVRYRLQPLGGAFTDWQSANVFSQLDAGSYLVEVEFNGSSNCVSQHALTIPNGSGIQASPPTVLSITDENVCTGTEGRLLIQAGDEASVFFSFDEGTTFSQDTEYNGLPPGDYEIITAVSPLGCGLSEAIGITIGSVNEIELPAVAVFDPVSCVLPDGRILFEAAGDGFEYTIDGGDNWSGQADFTQLAAGQYQLGVRSGNQLCETLGSESIELRFINRPVVTMVDHASPSSCDGAGAFINIAANTIGTATLKYSIDNGLNWQDDPFFADPPAGNYQVIVRSENDEGQLLCQTSWPSVIVIDSVEVGAPPPVELVADTPPTACGSSDGSLVYAAGNNLELDYSLDGGQNWQYDGTFEGLAAGWHYVSVREAGGDCSFYAVDSILLLSANEAWITQLSVAPLTDCNLNDGSITLEVVNANTDTRYSIDGGTSWSDAPDFDNLASGTYQPAVRQADGQCLSLWRDAVILEESAMVELEFPSVTNVSDCGLTDGAIILYEGASDWEYRLSGTEGWTTDPDFHSLLAANYTIEARHVDYPACRDTLEVNVGQETIYSAGVPEVFTTMGNACLAVSPSVAVSGGLPAGESVYYRVNEGAWTAGPLISELAAGIHTLSAARGPDGCGAGPELTINLTNEDTLLPPGVFSLAPTHCDSSNGSIALTVLPPIDTVLTYSIDGGGSWQVSPDFYDLTAGDYRVMVRNAMAGCTVEVAELITLSAANVVGIDTVTTVQADGCGNMAASITIAASGEDVEYSIDGGMNWQFTETFSGLTAGQYSVAVRSATDTAGTCATNWAGSVTIDSVLQFAEPQLTLTSLIVPTSCEQANGEIGFEYTGNTDYEFSIDGGGSWSVANVFSGLASGNYTLLARPLTGACVFDDLLEINLAAVSAPAINDVLVSGLSDCGATDASLEIEAEQLTPTTEFSIDGGHNWQGVPAFTALSAGSYVVALRDTVTGCTFAWLDTLTIHPVAVPVVGSVQTTDPTDCGLADGQLTLTFAPASAAGSLAELNGPAFALTTGGTIDSLPAGQYSLTIMNADGLCRSLVTDTLVLSEPEVVLLDSILAVDPSGCGSQDGYLSLYPVQSEWEYSIDGGTHFQDWPLFTDLAAGTYWPVARSRSRPGCADAQAGIALDNIGFSSGSNLQADVRLLDNCSPLATGQVDLSGTSESLLFSINGGSTWTADSSFTDIDLTIDSLHLSVASSDTTCFQYDLLSIALPVVSHGAAVWLDTLIDASCGDLSDGSIRVSGVGTGELQYDWSGGQSGPEAGALAAGNYTVSITDAAGCVDSMSVEVMAAGAEVPRDLNFLLPQQALMGSTVRLIDISTGNYPGVNWIIDSLTTEFIRARDRSVFVSFPETGEFVIGLSVMTAGGCPATLYKQIEIVATVEELEVQAFGGNNGGFLDFTVYPNPTAGACWLEVRMATEAPLEVSMHDPNGNELHRSEHGWSLEHLVDLDLVGQPAGAYPLLVRSGQHYQYVYLIRQ